MRGQFCGEVSSDENYTVGWKVDVIHILHNAKLV